MKTLQGRQKVWLTNSYNSIARVNETARDRGNDEAISLFGFSHDNCDMSNAGWTHVGYAEITVTLHDEGTIVRNQVAQLEEQIQSVRATAEQAINELRSRISKLTAIAYEAVEVEQ